MIFAWSFSLKRIISNEKNYNYPVDKTVSKVVICKWLFFVLLILKPRKISQPAINLDLFFLEDFYINPYMFGLDFFPKKNCLQLKKMNCYSSPVGPCCESKDLPFDKIA